jgi:hypothetical protein
MDYLIAMKRMQKHFRQQTAAGLQAIAPWQRTLQNTTYETGKKI